jgi:signal transduction histidine kinase/ActR/RegA family two-component response regulator
MPDPLVTPDSGSRTRGGAAPWWLSFLAEASTLLASTLDYEVTLDALARLCVPTLADLCVIDMQGEDGGIRRVAAAHAESDKADVVRRLREGFPPDVHGSHPVATVLRTGRPETAATITPEILARIAPEAEHRAIAAALDYTSYIVVPFVARGRTLGALSLVSGVSGRRYTGADLVVATDLARRAALALDNARLYTESEARRRAAEALADTGRMLSQSLDVAEVARRVADSVRRLIRANPSVVYRLDRATGDYLPLAISGDAGPRFGRDFRIPSGVGAVGLAVRERAPVVTTDLTSDPRIELDAETRTRLQAAPHRAALVVPLMIHGDVIGALLVGDRAGRVFTGEEVQLVQVFADQAGIALENARLYEEATRRREAEQGARADAEAANRAKDHFLATLSHELRTPLTAMLGWTRLLRTGRLDEVAAARALASVERNTELLTQLIDDMLDVSRIASGKLVLDPRPLDLLVVIDAALDAVRPAADAKAVTVETALDPSAGPVWGDPGRLQQVMWNLLSNAVKFTPARGRVDVRLERVQDGARITVRDTGRGIRADFLPHIFDPFQQADTGSTRRYGGLGLGLAIARQLVEMHGGSIRAESEGDGRGATFTVTLPGIGVDGPIPTDRPQAPQAPLPRLDGARVLVVDDEADARDLVMAAVAGTGAEVRGVPSAREALAAVGAATPDVVVTDLAMPGEDGYDLLARIRALGGRAARTPIIALSAFARVEDRERALMSGFAAHVAKPVEPVALCRLIEALVRDARVS